MIICIVFITKYSQKYFKTLQQSLGKINGKIDEIYSNLNIVSAYNAFDEEYVEFKKENKKLATAFAKSTNYSGMIIPITVILRLLANAFVVITTFLLVHYNIIPLNAGVSLLPTFLIFVNMIQTPIQNISQAVPLFQGAFASSERIFDFIETKNEEEDKGQDFVFDPLNDTIEFKNVSFSYSKDKPVLSNLSFKLQSGQKCAIVGPTGSGKTTIVNLLMRFYEINEGQILINNVPINKINKASLRNLFSMVLQDT
jgi:ATP-binding cassette subfamily B protein